MGSHVAMGLCVICKKETGEILLSTRIDRDGKLKEIFDEKFVTTPTSVCSECRKTYLTEGIMLISPESGKLLIITVNFYSKLTRQPIPDDRIMFMTEKVADELLELAKKIGTEIESDNEMSPEAPKEGMEHKEL